MYTIGKVNNKGNIIPVHVYKNRDSYTCDEKRFHILFIESGTGSITYTGHKELFMGPVLFCLNEEEIPRLGQTSNLMARSIYLSPEFVNNRFNYENLREISDQFTLTDIRDRNWLKAFFERNKDYTGRINLSLAAAKRLDKLYDFLEQQLSEQPDFYWPCRSRSFLIEILFLIEECRFMENKGSGLFTAGYSEDVERVILYLYSNYGRKITIPEVVSEFNIDRTTLARKFKEEVGDTVINCLIKLRINIAAGMLRDTLIPISEIMYRVGFGDLSHFNRTFKKHTSFNPSDYRQKYNILMN